MDTKVCNRCKQAKPLSDFYTDKSRPDGLLYRCKPCHKEYIGSDSSLRRRREHARKPDARQNAFHWKLKQKYGITLDQWHAMLVQQSGRCAACGDPFSSDTKGTHVDHCHKSGRVRALLCSACNTSEGLLQGDPERILKLLAYVCGDEGQEPLQWHLTRWISST